MTSPRSLSVLSALLLGSLTSCVSHHRLPENYTGPTATIRITAVTTGSVKGEAFKVEKVDGKLVAGTVLATPRGGGMGVAVRDLEFQVPARPLTLTLSAHTLYAADGVAMVDSLSGNNRSVSGDIAFTPKAGGRYTVRGSLAKDAEAVWLVDDKTGKVTGPKVTKH